MLLNGYDVVLVSTENEYTSHQQSSKIKPEVLEWIQRLSGKQTFIEISLTHGEFKHQSLKMFTPYYTNTLWV